MRASVSPVHLTDEAGPAGERVTGPDAVPPIGLPAGSGRPRVLVTFGTVFADPRVVGPMLRSLSALDIDLVATLGLDGKPEDYDLDPERVLLCRSCRWRSC